MSKGMRLPKRVYDMIEEKVIDFYINNNISIPADPFKICKNLGYILRPYSRLPRDQVEKLISDDQDGISFYDPGRETFIICYDYQSIGRQCFTIAHELGHIVLGHKLSSPLAEAIVYGNPKLVHLAH